MKFSLNCGLKNSMKSSLKVAQLAVGDTHFLLLTTTGSVYGMGSCVYGELGLGVVTPFVSVLQRVTRFDHGEYDDNDNGDADGNDDGNVHDSGVDGADSNGNGSDAFIGHDSVNSYIDPVPQAGSSAVYIAAGAHYSAVIVHHTSSTNTSSGGTNISYGVASTGCTLSNGGTSSRGTSSGGATTEGTNSLYTFGHGAYYKLGHGTFLGKTTT